MKEVFEFNWKDFEDKKLLIRVNNYEEQVQCIDFITKHYNVNKKHINYFEYEESWNHIIYRAISGDKWLRVREDALKKDDIYIEFKNIKQEETETNNKKEFDWDGFKNVEFDVVLKNNEEANSFFNAMYDKYNIENRISYDEYFDFIERDAVFIKYNEYGYGKWLLDSTLPDKIVNWSDYMDNNYFNQRDESVDLENIKNNAYKAILKELNKEDELKFSHEEIKDKFFYIDKQVLINCKNIFKSIENETDLRKIDDALNIIDKMIDVKNKLLNDFDI